MKKYDREIDRMVMQTRQVSDFGETLVVRNIGGINTLTDSCDKGVAVVVPAGRHARLVGFGQQLGLRDRDILTIVRVLGNSRIGFDVVKLAGLRVLLVDLAEGQRVDVLPTAEPAVAHAALRSPLPVLYGAAVASIPAYVVA